MRILGIDPGLQTTGYGAIDIVPPQGRRPARFKLVEAGVIRTTPESPLSLRLESLYSGTCEVLADCQPQVVIIEELYSTYRHPRTAILMGHARGTVFLAAGQSKVPVISYAATEMKRAIAGSGRASKGQIQRTVQQRLNLRSLPSPADVADALALALCHGIRVRTGRERELAELESPTTSL